MAESTEKDKQVAPAESARREERRLTKVIDRVYADLELEIYYQEKMLDNTNEFRAKMIEWMQTTQTLVRIYRGEMERMGKQLEQHRSHKEVHYSDKKKRLYQYDT